jgi:hypothetical protein
VVNGGVGEEALRGCAVVRQAHQPGVVPVVRQAVTELVEVHQPLVEGRSLSLSKGGVGLMEKKAALR